MANRGLCSGGYVTTYGDVARLAGSPRAARQVGGVPEKTTGREYPARNRVVNRHGVISLTGPDLQRQRQALLSEGVQVSGSGQIDLQSIAGYVTPLPKKRGNAKLHLRRWGWQGRLIGLQTTGLRSTAPTAGFRSTLVSPLLIASWTVSVIKTSLPLMVTAALSRIRALGCTSDGLYGNTKLNGACLPSVRTARCASTDGASAGKHQTGLPLIPHPAVRPLSV